MREEPTTIGMTTMTTNRPTMREADMAAAPINFRALNARALAALPWLLRRLLPDGRRKGDELVARSPVTARAKAMKVNMTTGRWLDVSCRRSGTDIVSLLAYILNCGQHAAARHLEKIIRDRECQAARSGRAPDRR
jgi:hypothetical protein